MAVTACGTTFSFTPANGTLCTVGKLKSIGEVSPDSKEIDVTTLDSAGGYRQYAQGYRDAGTLTLEGYHDSGDAGQAALRSAFSTGAAGSALITFPDGAKAAFSAFVKSYSLGAAEVGGAVGFSATLRLTGGVTFTSGT